MVEERRVSGTASSSTNRNSPPYGGREGPKATTLLGFRTAEEQQLLSAMFSNEFFESVTWVRDEHGQNKLKQEVVWNNPVFRSRSTGKEVNMLERWQEGTTGFPLVDAGMRELQQTGFMHPQVRLVCANFLVRLLGVNWTHGQDYLARAQIDYDWSINDCNWHWCTSLAMFAPTLCFADSSSSCDAGEGRDAVGMTGSMTATDTSRSPSRLQMNTGESIVLSPAEESRRHDPHCTYMKAWVPELKDVPAEDVHDWETTHHKYSVVHRVTESVTRSARTEGNVESCESVCGASVQYPAPLFKARDARARCRRMYENANNRIRSRELLLSIVPHGGRLGGGES